MSNFEIGFDFIENEVSFVDRLQVGSEEAFETLVNFYQAPIYNLAYRILGDRAEAADVVQETFLKIFKGIRSFRGESGLKTWIYRIAISESLNRQRWWRRWRKHVSCSIEEPLESTNGSRFLQVVDSKPNPELACSRNELEGAIQRALATLAIDQRIVVILRDIEGLSYEAIAAALNISLGTVKSRLWRARGELKCKLEFLVKS